MATSKFTDDKSKTTGRVNVIGDKRAGTVFSPLKDESGKPLFARPSTSPSDLELSRLRAMFRSPTSSAIKTALSEWRSNPDRSFRAELETLLFATAIGLKNPVFVRVGAVFVLAKTGCCTDDLRRVVKSLENSEHPEDVRVRDAAIKKVSQ